MESDGLIAFGRKFDYIVMKAHQKFKTVPLAAHVNIVSMTFQPAYP